MCSNFIKNFCLHFDTLGRARKKVIKKGRCEVRERKRMDEEDVEIVKTIKTYFLLMYS